MFMDNSKTVEFNATLAELYQVISPVTLYEAWSRLGRLIFCIVFAFFGTLLNGYFVSSFFVEDTLKKVGNVFACCLGLVDLCITGIAMPISAVVLLSGCGDNPTTCRFQHFIVNAATHAYMFFYVLVGAENYYRVCRVTDMYNRFTSMRVGLMAVMVAALSLGLSATGTILGLDYDYCERKHFGSFQYRAFTGVTFFVLPFMITSYFLVATAVRLHQRSKKSQYKRSLQYELDKSQSTLNILAFALFVVSWLPYAVVVYRYPNTKNYTFYMLAWFGVLRCVYNSVMYSIINKSFSRAYAHLFNYCCCKSSLSSSFSNRHRRAFENHPTTECNVHLMGNAMNAMTNPQRASSSRDTQEL